MSIVATSYPQAGPGHQPPSCGGPWDPISVSVQGRSILGRWHMLVRVCCRNDQGEQHVHEYDAAAQRWDPQYGPDLVWLAGQTLVEYFEGGLR